MWNIQIIIIIIHVHVFALSAIFDHLLFEVAPLLLVDQHQVQVVAHGELLVDVSHGGSQIITGQE